MKKIKESKFEYLLLIFFVAGLAMLIGSGFLLNLHIKNKNSLCTVDAQITRIYSNNDNHSVYVSYEIDGVKYNNVRYNEYNSSMYEGKTIQIYYNPENPGQIASINGNLIACIMLAIMGIAFSLVGSIIPMKKMKETARRKKLKQTGNPVKCFVTEIKVDRSIKVNGRHVNRILYCSPLNDNTKVYKSASFRFENNVSNGELLTVYVNPKMPEKYYVDLCSLDGRNINMLSQDEMPEINYEGVGNSEVQVKYCRYCGGRVDNNEPRCPYCNSVMD